MAWHKLLLSQEGGTVKSRVCVVQMDEEHGTGVYEVECNGSYDDGVVGVFLQWSHESSEPVSNTMVTG